MSSLVLPSHVGDQRFGKQRQVAPLGVSDPHNEARPLTYQQEVGGKLVIVANAEAMNWRLPVDEMRGMALEQEKKRVKRGDAQKSVDWAHVMLQYWEDRRNAAWDRRNGRTSVGAFTFTNTRHKAPTK